MLHLQHRCALSLQHRNARRFAAFLHRQAAGEYRERLRQPRRPQIDFVDRLARLQLPIWLGLRMRIRMRLRLRCRSQRPRAQRAVRMRRHKVFAFVMPGDRAQRLRRLPAHLSGACSQIPQHDLAALVRDQEFIVVERIVYELDDGARVAFAQHIYRFVPVDDVAAECERLDVHHMDVALLGADIQPLAGDRKMQTGDVLALELQALDNLRLFLPEVPQVQRVVGGRTNQCALVHEERDVQYGARGLVLVPHVRVDARPTQTAIVGVLILSGMCVSV